MIHVVVKEFYGDFDIRQTEIVGASSGDKATASLYANKLNSTRTERDIEQCVRYYVEDVRELR